MRDRKIIPVKLWYILTWKGYFHEHFYLITFKWILSVNPKKGLNVNIVEGETLELN